MTGLILKDLLNLKKQAKVYLILVIFYFVYGAVFENSSMFSSMMTMVAVRLVRMMTATPEKIAAWISVWNLLPQKRHGIN